MRSGSHLSSVETNDLLVNQFGGTTILDQRIRWKRKRWFGSSRINALIIVIKNVENATRRSKQILKSHPPQFLKILSLINNDGIIFPLEFGTCLHQLLWHF